MSSTSCWSTSRPGSGPSPSSGISEILTIRWTQVDFKAGVVRLEVGSTKSGEGRVLPFHVLPQLADLLRRQRARTDQKERKHGRVVPWVFHRRGKKIL